MHIWGDEDFDWGMLYEAEADICRLYSRITGKHPMIKEKYGTLRYECKFMWLNTEAEYKLFVKILYKMIRRYPAVALEIVDDFLWCMEDEEEQHKLQIEAETLREIALRSLT